MADSLFKVAHIDCGGSLSRPCFVSQYLVYFQVLQFS